MEVEEAMDIRRRIRITPRNKNIMKSQEEVGECHHLIEVGEDQDRRKDLLQLMDIEVVMIREVVARVEGIQMVASRREEEVGLHHWSGPPLQILDVSSFEQGN
jgi:hypothetical protein